MSSPKFRGTLLSTEPVIIYSGSYAARPEPSEFSLLQDALSSHEVTWLVLVAWTAEPGSTSARTIADWSKGRLAKHPKHRIIFMANTMHEERNLSALGVEAFFIHQNCFVDRSLFKPNDGSQTSASAQRYMAVYNAQFLEFKRHSLCVNLPQDQLALIGYNFGAGYFSKVKTLLPNAYYANLSTDGSTKWLTQASVNQIYNESSVALCLSQAEGAMHASMEYLLSGLPVVTTLSKGGRDYFFDGRFVRWCNDDPASIADSVHALASELIPRSFVREQTIEKVDKHLAERLPLLAKKIGITNQQLTDSLKASYNDKLITPVEIDDILSRLQLA